jgi:hypothetical protein
VDTRTGFDIAETFAISEWSKGLTKETDLAGEFFDKAIFLVSIDTNFKLVGREEVYKLRENRSAKIHLLPREQTRSSKMVTSEASNRDRKNSRRPLDSFNQAVTTTAQIRLSWDRTVTESGIQDASHDPSRYGRLARLKLSPNLPDQLQSKLDLPRGCGRRGDLAGAGNDDAISIKDRIVGHRRIEVGAIQNVEHLDPELRIKRF